MINKRPVLSILFGLIFFSVGGYASAGDAFNQLGDANSGGGRSFDGAGVYKSAVIVKGLEKSGSNIFDDVRDVGKSQPMQQVKNFVKEHKTGIVMTVGGALIGAALIGGVGGALTGGFLVLGFFLFKSLMKIF
jgi:hypothetical protein